MLYTIDGQEIYVLKKDLAEKIAKLIHEWEEITGATVANIEPCRTGPDNILTHVKLTVEL